MPDSQGPLEVARPLRGSEFMREKAMVLVLSEAAGKEGKREERKIA